MQNDVKKTLDDIINCNTKEEGILKVLQLVIELQKLSFIEFEQIKNYIKETL